MDRVVSPQPDWSGRVVGHYRLLGPLGAGGMGVVYDAEDLRLGRRVAIKVLRPDRVGDQAAAERLLREARAISTLNHPNICRIFDVGDLDGQPFLVMERLEGRTLQHAAAGRSLPCAQVLEIGSKLADAVHAAHARGLVHRDIKPANVFLTTDGDVRLLDFGLASGVAGADSETETATGTDGKALTREPGSVAGTAAYMSPEQARGEDLDTRTDLFSLGAVIYFMATGRQPFAGQTAALLFEGLLNREAVPARELNADLPAGLDAVLAKALEKDRALRYQTGADLAVDLRRLARATPGQQPVSAVARTGSGGAATRRPGAARWAVASLACAALALAAIVGFLSRDREPQGTQPRFTQLTFRRGIVTSARFTPDGHTVVFSALWDGRPPEVFSRRLDGSPSVSLGLPPATLLSVSSRGELAILLAPAGEHGVKWLGTLARVPISGGPPRSLLDSVLDADWSPDGRDLAAIRWTGGAYQLEYPLGSVLWRPCPDTRLRVSPDGRRVAVLDTSRVVIVERTGERRSLATPPLHQRLAWAHDGSALLLDAGDSDLRRTLRRLTLDGSIDELAAQAGTLVVHDVSADGRVLVHHGFERWVVRARAPDEADEHDASAFANTALRGMSDNGEQLLLWDGGDGPPGSLLLQSSRGGAAVRLGEGDAAGLSGDGRWVLNRIAAGSVESLALSPTGSGEPVRLSLAPLQGAGGLWHIDSGRIGFTATEAGQPARSFLARLPSGPVTAITPPGTIAIPDILPSGEVLARTADGSLAFYPTAETGAARRLVSKLPVAPDVEPLRVASTGRFVFVRHGSVPARIDRLDLTDGVRRPWTALRPAESIPVAHIWSILLTPDGRGYAYTYGIYLQDLFLVDGLPLR